MLVTFKECGGHSKLLKQELVFQNSPEVWFGSSNLSLTYFVLNFVKIQDSEIENWSCNISVKAVRGWGGGKTKQQQGHPRPLGPISLKLCTGNVSDVVCSNPSFTVWQQQSSTVKIVFTLQQFSQGYCLWSGAMVKFLRVTLSVFSINLLRLTLKRQVALCHL